MRTHRESGPASPMKKDTSHFQENGRGNPIEEAVMPDGAGESISRLLTYPEISSSGPTRSLAPFCFATLMDCMIRDALPSKSRAH